MGGITVVQESDQGVGALVRLMTVPAHQRDDRWLEEGLQKAVELEMSTSRHTCTRRGSPLGPPDPGP